MLTKTSAVGARRFSQGALHDILAQGIMYVMFLGSTCHVPTPKGQEFSFEAMQSLTASTRRLVAISDSFSSYVHTSLGCARDAKAP